VLPSKLDARTRTVSSTCACNIPADAKTITDKTITLFIVASPFSKKTESVLYYTMTD
jgi:hypothetical protein